MKEDSLQLPVIKIKSQNAILQTWIASGKIEPPKERLPPGTLVEIRDLANNPLGLGFYNARTRIALRVLTRQPGEKIDEDFFFRRFAEAKVLRQPLFQNQNSILRFIHSEGDGLSGLVIDLFGRYIIIEWFSAGMFRLRETIKRSLLRLFPEYEVYWFAEKRVQKQESFDCWEMPPPPPFVALENGLQFKINVGSHRKTGFFADQRENRKFLAEICHDAHVADLCCHTGAFSIYAKKLGKAQHVTAVDLDENSLTLVAENAKLNDVDIVTVQMDIYQWLRQAKEESKLFDVVILDPPKQTRDPNLISEALGKYVALNRLAIDIIKPGGILLTCSCSGLITEDQFIDAIKRASSHSGKQLQIFRVSGAGVDHPFMALAPESRYLKAIWARVLI